MTVGDAVNVGAAANEGDTVTARYLSFHPIASLQFSCCNLSVCEKDWRSRARAAKAT